MHIVPNDNSGNREIQVELGGKLYHFRTYFTQGQYDGWLMDIGDGNGQPLLTGKRITPGAPNLLKGNGDTFEGLQLAAVVIEGDETKPEALGNGTYLAWFGEGETNPFVIGDPMIDIPAEDWAFRDTSDYYFGETNAGDVYVRSEIRNPPDDPILAMDAHGDVYIKDYVVPGASNDYLYHDGDDIVLRD